MKNNNIIYVLIVALVISVAAYFYFENKNKKDKEAALAPLPGSNPPVPVTNPALPAATVTTGSVNIFPLMMGSKGRAVKLLQILAIVKPDGVWGSNTDIAVKNNLKISSIDADTLYRLCAAKDESKSFPLMIGSKGAFVKALQISYDLPIDGIFGKATKAAAGNEVDRVAFNKRIGNIIKFG